MELFGPVKKRTLVVANKSDLPESDEILKFLKEDVVKGRYPVYAVSSAKGKGIENIKNVIFDSLDIIRVYTKEPGKPPSMEDPLILKKGSNVKDAAARIHKDFARNLKYAKVWGSSKFPGQRVEQDYVLKDKDIVEFHI